MCFMVKIRFDKFPRTTAEILHQSGAIEPCGGCGVDTKEKLVGLFMFSDEASGFPFFLPKGTALKNALIDDWRDIHNP